MRVLLSLGLGLSLALVVACVPIQPPTPAPDATAQAEEEPATVITATAPLTATPVLTETVAPTDTAVLTGTAPLTDTPPLTGTPTVTATVAPTVTPPLTATVTPTVTETPTGTVTPPPGEETPTPEPTPGEPTTPTPTPTSGPTATPTTPPTNTPVPTPTFTPGPPPTPTPLPAGVFARNHRSFREGSDLIVVGEVINGGPAPVYGVKVIATFYNAANQLVGAQEGFAYLPQTLPTQANPFKVRLPNAPGLVERYELALTWGDLSVVTYDRATITREEVSQEGGLRIHGDIRNDHFMELRGLVVVVTLYDSAGVVVDVLTGSTGVATLAPGDSTTFEVVSAQPVTYASYLVQIEGMLLR